MNPEMAHTDKPTITLTEARKLDRKIINHFEVMNHYTQEVWTDMAVMRDTLGYKHFDFKDWPEYLTARTEAYIHLKADGDNLIWGFYLDGYSERDIAEKLGTSKTSVNRSLKKMKRETLPSNVTPITKGRDGKEYPRMKERIRPRTQTEEIAYCGDGWTESYGFLTRWMTSLTSKTSNPTGEQLSQLESFLRRSLTKVMKMREEWEQNNS